MAKTVLVINSGSSSIKYQLVDLESGEGLASGLVEKIGEPVDGHYKHEYNGEKHELEEPIHDHEQGLRRVLGFFKEYGPGPVRSRHRRRRSPCGSGRIPLPEAGPP